MHQPLDLPRLPPWESPQYKRNSKPSAVRHTNSSTSSVFGDPSTYTPLNHKNERSRQRSKAKIETAAGTHDLEAEQDYDVSPFVLHQNILNQTKIDQTQQQEIAMRRVFNKERPVPDSVLSTPYYQSLWREQEELIAEQTADTNPTFDFATSSQDLYKQLKKFQTAFIQEEAWKYSAEKR